MDDPERCGRCGGAGALTAIEGMHPRDWPAWVHPADYAVQCPECGPWPDDVSEDDPFEKIGEQLVFNGWGLDYEGPG
jgi:hypothetical protein